MFEYHDDQASNVAVAGDFNGWSPARLLLARTSGGLWHVAIDPPAPGRYAYKFVVDGRWVEDSENGLKEPDGFGGMNSLLRLP